MKHILPYALGRSHFVPFRGDQCVVHLQWNQFSLTNSDVYVCVIYILIIRFVRMLTIKMHYIYIYRLIVLDVWHWSEFV